MSKNHVLMRDVISRYHPAFRASADLRRYGLAHSDIFNVERLVEESLAAVGPYEFIDGEHADFSDGTDSKTASIYPTALTHTGRTFKGEISGVETAGGGQKSGGLRCVIYNPHRDCLMYYFLPKSFWRQYIVIHPSSQIGKVQFTYNKEHNYIPKFWGMECEGFEQLALAGH
jgi:hypothetical protein